MNNYWELQKARNSVIRKRLLEALRSVRMLDRKGVIVEGVVIRGGVAQIQVDGRKVLPAGAWAQQCRAGAVLGHVGDGSKGKTVVLWRRDKPLVH